jgi:hypothetical protein
LSGAVCCYTLGMEILGDLYMKGLNYIEESRLGCSITILLSVLALGLIAATFGFQRDWTPGCDGLGAGLPFAFVCNYSSGGSPISSMNVIDGADFPFISPIGFIANFIFYFALLSACYFILQTYRLRRREPQK